MLGQMLRGINTAVLAAGTTEAEHQVGEAALDVAFHVCISQTIYIVEEGKYLTVILKEAYHRFVQSRKFLIRFVTAGIMGAAAVEDIAATIARLILRDSLAEGETITAHHQRSLVVILGESGRTVLRMRVKNIGVSNFKSIGTTECRLLDGSELWQFREPLQRVHQIGIWEIAHLCQQFTQVLHGGRNAVNKMFLMLKIASEPVSAQHLKCAEENEQTELVNKMAHRGNLGKLLQRVVIFIHQVATQLMRVFCRSLPYERCQIVIIRSATPALEIDEIGISLSIEHYIARLEVTVKEAVAPLCHQIVGKKLKTSFQLQFVEVESRLLQKTIFEIVKVEQHAVLIKIRLRVAVGEIQLARTSYLDIRQLADSLKQEVLLLFVISSARGTPFGKGIEKRNLAQVRLDVPQLILTDSKDTGYRKFAFGKMTAQIDESMIFITAGADNSNYSATKMVCNSIIFAVTARSGKFLHICRFLSPPLLV